jgi:hypothetical protein
VGAVCLLRFRQTGVYYLVIFRGPAPPSKVARRAGANNCGAPPPRLHLRVRLPPTPAAGEAAKTLERFQDMWR